MCFSVSAGLGVFSSQMRTIFKIPWTEKEVCYTEFSDNQNILEQIAQDVARPRHFVGNVSISSPSHLELKKGVGVFSLN